MPTITIPEHEREINEDWWECTGEVRVAQNNDVFLDVYGKVQHRASAFHETATFPILRRKELTGWDWIRTLEEDEILLRAGDEEVYWIRRKIKNGLNEWRVYGWESWSSSRKQSDVTIADKFSPSTCEILFPKEGE